MNYQNPGVFRESVPGRIDAIGVKELENIWTKELAVQNKQADVVLRVNTLKTSKSKLINDLHNEKIEAESINGYRIP